MRKIILYISITVIVVATFFAMLKVDKNTKGVADFLNANTVFKIENGSIIILNEEFRLK